jgi:histidine phosphotransferase ChpT
MEIRMDLYMAESLCARLCHDIVGPISAINNGIELLEDTGGSLDLESFELIKLSAEAAARRLKFLRIAFGVARDERFPGAEAREIAAGWFAEGRVRLEWPEPEAEAAARIPAERLRLAFNLLLLARDSLPRGGVVRVESGPNEGSESLVVAALGERAQLSETVAGALRDGVEASDLDARIVQAFFTTQLAAKLGSTIETSVKEGQWVRLAISF